MVATVVASHRSAASVLAAMHNAEASSSDDDDDDPEMDKALAQAVLESEMEEFGPMQVDPAVQRQNDIMAEVARRRKEVQGDATKRKCDAIFDHFDVDHDGYLNYKELHALGQATGGELPHPAYVSICGEIGADPSKGVTKALLLCIYTDANLGDAHRDYNLIFPS